MQFSLKRLLVLFAFANLLIAAAFVFPPLLSTIVFTFVSLVVLPPIVIVGVVHTRGSQQAFFLGAMVTGMPHFIMNLYWLVVVSMTLHFEQLAGTAEELGSFGVFHLGFIILGALGGLMGMVAHATLLSAKKPDDSKSVREEKNAGPWGEEEQVTDIAESQKVNLPR